jgi:hypothetical protein
VGSLLDRRAALARKLVELDDRDLDKVEPVVEAVRCQARVRALFAAGAQVPSGLLAVAVAEQPADEPGYDEPVVVAQRCTTCGAVGVLGAEWRCRCDATAAEAACAELELLTEPALAAEIAGAASSTSDLRPGDRVEVVESVGSRTGPRYRFGKWIGTEINERSGSLWHLVQLEDGPVRSFEFVRRVG